MRVAEVAECMAAPMKSRVTRPLNVVGGKINKRGAFDYEAFYTNELQKKHADKSYRYFNNINRLAKHFPLAHLDSSERLVTAWCSNDYVSYKSSPKLINAECYSWGWGEIQKC